MLSVDEDAVICDMAETYHIYDIYAFPPFTIARLANGLRSSSRIKCILSGNREPLDTVLLAVIADRLSLLWWAKTKDGQKNLNRPQLIADTLRIKVDSGNLSEFETPDDYEAARAKILNNVAGGERVWQTE